MRTTSTYSVIGIIGIVLSGCASVSTGVEEAEVAATAAMPTLPDDWSSVQELVVGQPVGWIESFNDPILRELVLEAQFNNKDLASAAANLARARALSGSSSCVIS